MGKDKIPLKELELYLGVNMVFMNIESRIKVEGILERTVRALESGATPKQIKKVFGKYISAWQPERTYG